MNGKTGTDDEINRRSRSQSSATTEENIGPMRIILRTRVTDIPGEALKRPYTLGHAFCKKIMNRPLNPTVSISGYDGMYIPHSFDSAVPLKRWFIFDLNVTGILSKKEIKDIPHYVYQVSVIDGQW